ncbi:hypothetical protein [Nocardioides insulae]|uniref:hypothetical protein n=1 Tax=Nocardioides insulae TaxID=394734 RepID=UPI0004146D96|nr:hypothetical protein [Nocardioides insulae]
MNTIMNQLMSATTAIRPAFVRPATPGASAFVRVQGDICVSTATAAKVRDPKFALSQVDVAYGHVQGTKSWRSLPG